MIFLILVKFTWQKQMPYGLNIASLDWIIQKFYLKNKI